MPKQLRKVFSAQVNNFLKKKKKEKCQILAKNTQTQKQNQNKL